MLLFLLLLLVLLACSFAISGSETALFALSPQERRDFAQSKSRFQRLALRLMEHPRQVLMTVLIANTAVNVAVFAVTYMAFRPAGKSGSKALAALVGVASVVAVLVFGEVLPKALALARARRLAPLAAPIINAVQIVTAPVREVLRLLFVEPLVRLLAPARPTEEEVSDEDLRRLVELSGDQAIITLSEQNMLQAVVTLPELTVRAVMVPRVDIQALPVVTARTELLAEFRRTGLKKLPVYGKDLDDIQGLLYARDLYLQPEAAPADLIRPVTYVPDVVNLLQLIRLFRDKRAQLAIAVDEYGGVSGLVTLEDVLEHIVGDLEVGENEEESPIERLGEETYRLAGALSVRPWRQRFGVADRYPEVETIGGLVLAALGRAPRVGDAVQLGNLRLEVERLRGRRIERVLVQMAPAARGEGPA